MVGCGFAGATTVRRLAGRLDARSELVALDAGRELYNYTILPRTLVEEVGPLHVTIPLETLFRGLPVDLRTEKVLAIRAPDRLVRTGRDELSYDLLVLATGSRAIPLHRDDESLVLYPKAWRHLERLRSMLRGMASDGHPERATPDVTAPRRFAVVGGGLTGIEFAAALREALNHPCSGCDGPRSDLQVDLFESAPRLIPRLAGRLGDHIRRLLEERGIRVFVNTRVHRISRNRLVVDGALIPVDVTLCCIGSRPNLRMEISGLGDTEHGLPVNRYLQSIADPRVFALGDNACIQGLPGSGDTKFASQAVRQGKLVADNVLRLLATRPLRAYRPGHHPVAVMLGAETASLAFRGRHCTGRLAGRIKRYLETHVP